MISRQEARQRLPSPNRRHFAGSRDRPPSSIRGPLSADYPAPFLPFGRGPLPVFTQPAPFLHIACRVPSVRFEPLALRASLRPVTSSREPRKRAFLGAQAVGGSFFLPAAP